jgi:hypothetical protein
MVGLNDKGFLVRGINNSVQFLIAAAKVVLMYYYSLLLILMPKSYKVCMMDIPINIYQRLILNIYFILKLKVMALRDSPHSCWLSL